MNLKKGIELIEEIEGTGNYVQRQRYYIVAIVAIRLTMNKGDVVKVPDRCLSHSIDRHLKVDDDGFFEHRVRIDRENLIPGIFYSVQGMKINSDRFGV